MKPELFASVYVFISPLNPPGWFKPIPRCKGYDTRWFNHEFLLSYFYNPYVSRWLNYALKNDYDKFKAEIDAITEIIEP